MLKGIPLVISPELLKVLAEMGHGDTITIGDAYFAAASMAKDSRLVRADGIRAELLVDAILQLMPLDNWAEYSVTVMGKPDNNGKPGDCEITRKLAAVVAKYEPDAAKKIKYADRFEFYDLARKSFAVVASGEPENYGCIILQKGVK